MNETPEIEELIERYLDLVRSGGAPDIAGFAKNYPEHEAELLELLPLVTEMESAENDPDVTVRISGAVSAASPAASARGGMPDLGNTDFHLIREISHGGMGTVYEAVQLSLGRKVAVKILSPSLLPDAAQRASFENEARMIAMLHHPNIVKILNAGCGGKVCYYAMELIQGTGLDRHKFADLREIARVGLQAARALAYAHRCGIMHRDVKPGNLLLDAEQQVRVCDFGIASILRKSGELVESAESRTGTLRYMAPERLAHGVNTFAADQYALGVTLYELVSGGPIFSETSRKELVQRICQAPAPKLKCREPDLAAIINKSLSYDPQNRYASMDEMAEDLQHFLNREPVSAASPSWGRRLALWARRKPAVAGLTLALVLALAAAMFASIYGLVRTRAAYRRAARNASAADAALTQVFDRMAELPPTPKNNELLQSLLPYYQMIAAERNLPEKQLRTANSVIGELAMRTGDFQLAERSFRSMAALGGGAFAQNQLAFALQRQERKAEAKALFAEVADQYAESESPEERFQAARALIAMSDEPEGAERTRAFGILEKLLSAQPDNPEYRFQYALLLGGNPKLHRKLQIPGVEPNAVVLLRKLFDAHPDRPEYGMALVELTLKRLSRPNLSGRRRQWQDVDSVMELAERLLGMWPNDPLIVSSVTRLHQRYIELLLKDDNKMRAARVTDRLLSILEVVFYNPDVPDTVKETLIRLQFEKLESLIKEGRGTTAANMAAKIRSELESYKGPSRTEFQESLKTFDARIDVSERHEPPRLLALMASSHQTVTYTVPLMVAETAVINLKIQFSLAVMSLKLSKVLVFMAV